MIPLSIGRGAVAGETPSLIAAARVLSPQLIEKLGAPSKTRTCDLLVRSQTLYPTELWARTEPTLESNIWEP